MTTSEEKADIFKYSLTEKSKVYKYILSDQFKHPDKNKIMPVIIYTKNKDISDIKKIIYISHWFTPLQLLAEYVKTQQYFLDNNYKYGFKTELSLIDEKEDFFLPDDMGLHEVWDDWHNGDRFLYLIFDKKEEEEKEEMCKDLKEARLNKHLLIDISNGFENFKE
jgi:hypothetical protein